MKTIVFIMLVFAATTLSVQLKIGDKIPSFVLKNQSAEEVNSNQFKGKFMVIDFGPHGVYLVDWAIRN